MTRSNSITHGRIREDRPRLLSRRESQVVELMGKGWSRAEISDRLGVSRKCVSVFIERARAKFRLKTSLQLRHLAFRWAMCPDKQNAIDHIGKPKSRV